jgi:hypothetical protein
LFSLVFDFPEGGKAQVGEYLLVALPIDRTEGIFVPLKLVVRRYGSYSLWVANPENLLEAREVTPGPIFGERVLIAAGLAPGERYLTELTGREREGQSLGGR